MEGNSVSPDPGIDRAVAEKVMGWKMQSDSVGVYFVDGQHRTRRIHAQPTVHDPADYFSPSSSVADAMEALKAIHVRAWWWQVTQTIDEYAVILLCGPPLQSGDRTVVTNRSQSLCLAICRAALSAVEKEAEHG